MRHVTDEEIGLFVSGGLEPDEVRRVVRHLIGRCRRARIGRYAEAFYDAHPRPIDPPPPEERFYDAPIDRAIARALAEAPRWLEEQRQVAEIGGR